MALDAILLSGIVNELKPKTEGAKIDKVQQPERDQILLTLRCGRENLKLLICAGAGNGRIQLSSASFENPKEPPMFCMLLRKYLVGGRIVSLEQAEWERLVMVDITSSNELGDSVDLRLAVELMGRSSNLVLIGADGRIIDCLRRMDFGGDAERVLLPGMKYRLPPPQKKPLVMTLSAEERRSIISGFEPEKSIDKSLMDAFSGLSPLICREIAARCQGDVELLPQALDAFIETVKSGELTPTMTSKDGRPTDFSFMRLCQYGSEYEQQSFPSFSELLDAYYSRREKLERRRRRAKELSRLVKTNRDRIAKKLALQREELLRTEDREQKRRSAELLTANLYRVKKGDRSVTVENYYENNEPCTIALDPLKTPQQNLTAMFKEYNKLKAARSHLTQLIADGEERLSYLNSVLDETERAETEADLAEIRRELLDLGYIKKQKNAKPEKCKKQGPLRFVSDDGFEILVGRNNTQNDELSCKLGRRSDIWLHTKSVHGSHVIISTYGENPPERTLLQAASLAVYYSQAREGGKTPVDYTELRYVKKPAGALPGKVIYTEQRTLTAEADEELAQRLMK